jgi:hypothetical protein
MKCTYQVAWILFLGIVLNLSGLLVLEPVFAQGSEPKTFSSPQAVVTELIDAAKKKDRPGMLAILGSETEKWITSGDPVQDKTGLERFVAAYDQKNEIEPEGDSKAVLVVGDDGFPFPFPIIKSAKGWLFDPEQGKEELLNRRIGRNELNTVQVLFAVNDAQREYATNDQDGDGVLEYAAKFRSSADKRNGLYWPARQDEAQSPLGPLIAEAVREGYALKADGVGTTETPVYHGYHFKMLTHQGEGAPGGASEYIVEGNMIGGFAVVAYPARYGNSGIMSFMIGHDGIVFDADLGPETAEEVQAMDAFNPVEGWKKVQPE